MIWLNIALVVVAIVLVGAIMLQNRSAGLGGAFGGSEGIHVRRGGEKRLYQVTVIASALFLILAAAHLFIR
jgi:protein translocase SecG subunit